MVGAAGGWEPSKRALGLGYGVSGTGSACRPASCLTSMSTRYAAAACADARRANERY